MTELRPTEQQLNELVNSPAGCAVCGGEFSNDWTPGGAGCGVDHLHDCVLLATATALRAARSLLADLRAEGCPTEAGNDGGSYGIVFCCYCDAAIDYSEPEPRGDHRPMEDGQPCLWVRLSELP